MFSAGYLRQCVGYKVGRVEQAEMALGAKMCLAAEKGKSKRGGSAKEKIVRW